MIISQPKELIGAFVNVRQGHPPSTSWGDFNALGLVRSGVLVAGVIYNNHEAYNLYMHIGAEEGSRWLTPAFLFAAFDYPFNQLKKNRVTAHVRGKNAKALNFVKKLGFAFEGKLRHYYKDDDAMIYGLLRDDCRFLEMRKAA